MKWLQDNPLGIALVATGGFLALLVLAMAVAWNSPVKVDADDTDTEDAGVSVSPLVAEKIGSLNEYRIVNERPVFNESRAPEIIVVDNASEESIDQTIEVKGAPEVRLTGVIITPGMKIASLTPVDTSQESVMAHEGQSLTGEFVGWQVSIVNPRDVVLESNNGQKLELELQVHDVAIKEPPKPKPVASSEQPKKGERDQAEGGADDNEKPLSRAEQIRQRIAERRNELRREQQALSVQNDDGGNRSQKTDNNNAYQNAIKARMRDSSKDKESDDEDG